MCLCLLVLILRHHLHLHLLLHHHLLLLQTSLECMMSNPDPWQREELLVSDYIGSGSLASPATISRETQVFCNLISGETARIRNIIIFRLAHCLSPDSWQCRDIDRNRYTDSLLISLNFDYINYVNLSKLTWQIEMTLRKYKIPGTDLWRSRGLAPKCSLWILTVLSFVLWRKIFAILRGVNCVVINLSLWWPNPQL